MAVVGVCGLYELAVKMVEIDSVGIAPDFKQEGGLAGWKTLVRPKISLKSL